MVGGSSAANHVIRGGGVLSLFFRWGKQKKIQRASHQKRGRPRVAEQRGNAVSRRRFEWHGADQRENEQVVAVGLYVGMG